MINIKKNRITLFLLASFFLLLGSSIYLLFRSTTLLMFNWTNILGISTSIGTIRSWLSGFEQYLPKWIIYSLPFSLWISSYILFVKVIWWDSKLLIRYVWFLCLPICSIIAELSQKINFIPGCFDIMDMYTILLGILFSFITITFHCSSKRETK